MIDEFKMNFYNREENRLEQDFQTLVDDVKSAAQVLDPIAFDAYVQNTVEDLAARGQITSDLVVNLLKAQALTDDRMVNPYSVSIAVQNCNHHIAINRPVINNNNKKPKGIPRPQWLTNNTPPENQLLNIVIFGMKSNGTGVHLSQVENAKGIGEDIHLWIAKDMQRELQDTKDLLMAANIRPKLHKQQFPTFHLQLQSHILNTRHVVQIE